MHPKNRHTSIQVFLLTLDPEGLAVRCFVVCIASRLACVPVDTRAVMQCKRAPKLRFTGEHLGRIKFAT